MKKDPRSQIQEVLGDNLIACICEGGAEDTGSCEPRSEEHTSELQSR